MKVHEETDTINANKPVHWLWWMWLIAIVILVGGSLVIAFLFTPFTPSKMFAGFVIGGLWGFGTGYYVNKLARWWGCR